VNEPLLISRLPSHFRMRIVSKVQKTNLVDVNVLILKSYNQLLLDIKVVQ